jgi:hypothetical protein
MAATATAVPAPVEAAPAPDPHARTARRVYLGSLLYAIASTALWLFLVATQKDGGVFFRSYNLDRQTLLAVGGNFLIFWIAWGWLWYRFKRFLLRKVGGLTREEMVPVFDSRMRGRPFDLRELLARHSERRIRIVDMIARRGRTVPGALAGFFFIYAHVAKDPKPDSLAWGLQDNFFGAVVYAWFFLLTYYSGGIFGRIAYGAHSRVMDGTLARANVLLIAMLWNLFKFVMIPVGMQLGGIFPPGAYGPLFVFIWISYLVSDSLSEIVGSLFGKQNIRVWGLGEVNRKSWAGTIACFVGSLAVCLWVVWAHQLPAPWLALALVVSLSNTLLELFSPRGTDDFTMACANALLCWGFGLLVYAGA